MTRTEQLARRIAKIKAQHQATIDALPRRGPRGGTNAKYIDGWVHSPHKTITRACNLVGGLTLPYHAGPAPTPASAIPECIVDKCVRAYEKIFGNVV